MITCFIYNYAVGRRRSCCNQSLSLRSLYPLKSSYTDYLNAKWSRPHIWYSIEGRVMKQAPSNPSCSQLTGRIGIHVALPQGHSVPRRGPNRQGWSLKSWGKSESGHGVLAAQRRLPVCVFALIFVHEHVSETEWEKQFAFECMTMLGRSWEICSCQSGLLDFSQTGSGTLWETSGSPKELPLSERCCITTRNTLCSPS